MNGVFCLQYSYEASAIQPVRVNDLLWIPKSESFTALFVWKYICYICESKILNQIVDFKKPFMMIKHLYVIIDVHKSRKYTIRSLVSIAQIMID